MPTRNTHTDAIELLREDHKRLRGLLGRLEKTTERASESREELLQRIEQEVKIHTTIEEEIFYPAYKAAVTKREDAKLYQEAIEEHHVADTVLGEIKQADVESDIFSAKAKVLKDVIEHHAQEEETQMFPRAKRAMEPSELRFLGSRLLERKRQLEADATGWLPTASKMLVAAASRVSRVTDGIRKTGAQASAAALGASSRKRSKASSGGSRAKSGKTSRGRASSGASSTKGSARSRSRKKAR
jgi:hypothetical protein